MKSTPAKTAFKDLPFNYRPPSVYGYSIPNNDKIYNANLNLPLTSYLDGFVVEYVVSKWDKLKKELMVCHKLRLIIISFKFDSLILIVG